MRISKDVFLALASFQKRDGASLIVEADGLRRAAAASLQGDDLAEVMAAIDAKPPAIDGGAMSDLERTLMYALVTWFSQLGVGHTGDIRLTQATFLSARVLITLGDELKLPSDVRKRATEATYKLACLPAAERPDVYDLPSVASRLERLLFAGA
ncbi:MAG TPA: hypothetical protein VM925_28915 [Labilithrix sp.]|nr:hypothetical protein [Labilithrix sp.]